jgi:ABC-type nitrate/sulfonate/bicarbonate transport system substrate-binding protein
VNLAQSARLFALAIACGSCGTADAPTPRDKVRVSVGPYLGNAPFYLAAAGGDFEALGLDVEFVTLGAGGLSVTALLTGGVDAWGGGVGLTQLGAVGQGGMLRIVADRGQLTPGECSYLGFVKREGLTDEQLASGAVAYSGGTSRQISALYLLELALTELGAPVDRFTTISLPPTASTDALRNQRLDVASDVEPGLSGLKTAGTYWFGGEELAPDFQWGMLMFGPRLLGPDREVGERFVAAYRRGVARFRDGKTPENLAVLAPVFGMTPEALAASCWPTVRADGRINLASLLEFQAWGVRRGHLDHTLDAADLWDSTFVVATDAVLRDFSTTTSGTSP